MEKIKYVEDCEVGDFVDSLFMINDFSFQTTKTGNDYLSLKLIDKTGSINAKKWNASLTDFKFLKNGGIYKVRGKVSSFNDISQVIIDSLVEVNTDEISLDEFVPVSNTSIKSMKEELMSFYNSIENEDCKALVKYFLSNNDIFNKFCLIPGAKLMHHTYAHGLLEHTLEVCRLSNMLAEFHKDKGIDRDLLIAASILHDISKVKEYEYTTVVEFTEESRLVGHIALDSIMVNDACRELGLSEEFTNKFLHLLVSHHGKLEWGSPVIPKTQEAVILHYADNISANVNREIDIVNGNK